MFLNGRGRGLDFLRMLYTCSKETTGGTRHLMFKEIALLEHELGSLNLTSGFSLMTFILYSNQMARFLFGGWG